jgi:hypothetical protein
MDVQVPRVFDFPSSYNTTFTPRAWEPISFQELRFLAENHRGLGDRQGHASGTCPRCCSPRRDSGSNLMLVDAQFLGGANPLLRYCLDPDC